MPVPVEDDDSELEGAIAVDKVDCFTVKRRSHDSQKSFHFKKKTNSEKMAEAFRLTEELVPGGGFADNQYRSDAQTGRFSRLEENIREVRFRVEESNTTTKELEKPQKDAKGISDDALVFQRKERVAASEESLKATIEQEELKKFAWRWARFCSQ